MQKYVTRCIVEKDGKKYKKGSIIEGLKPDEIERGLSEQWLEKVGNDDESAPPKPAPKDQKPPKEKPQKTLDQMNKAELFAKAAEFGIDVKDGVTVAEVKQKVKEAQEKKAKADLLAEAAELGITDVDDSMSIPDLRKRVKEARAK
jgi:hypothetical protein